VFLITNVLWTDEKNRFLVDTIRSIIIVKQHFKNISCTEFHTFLLEHPQLLKIITSSEKYEKSNSEDIYEQLSSKLINKFFFLKIKVHEFNFIQCY
jgi:hypothetical protein